MPSLEQEAAKAKALIEALRDEYDDQLTDDMIEGSTDLKEIMSWFVFRIGIDERSIEANKVYQKELGERCDRLQNRINRTKDRLFAVLSDLDVKKLELDCATLSLRAGQSKTVITDEKQIPKEYWKNKPVLNNALIKQVLSTDGEVPGAELSNATPSLAIRRK